MWLGVGVAKELQPLVLKPQFIIQFHGTTTVSTQNSSPVIGSINLRPSTRFKPLGIVPGGRKFTVV